MAKYSHVRFTYLRTTDGTPHTCLAVKVDPTANTISFATAPRESVDALVRFKARLRKIQQLGGVVPASLVKQMLRLKKDFSKSHSRSIALKRLASSPTVITLTVSSVDGLTAHDISRRIMLEISTDHSEKFSNKTYTSALRWLSTHHAEVVTEAMKLAASNA